MTTLDAFMECDRTAIEEAKRRLEELEARRPTRLPTDLLLLEEDAFIATYRSRYGLRPNAKDWSTWNKMEKHRERRRERR
jgi:hypothetical protein